MKLITRQWFNEEKTIILLTYTADGWSWEEVSEAVRQTNVMIETVSHLVDVIVDVNNTQLLPKEGTAFKAIEDALAIRHYRQRHTVVVGMRGMIAMLSKLVGRIA